MNDDNEAPDEIASFGHVNKPSNLRCVEGWSGPNTFFFYASEDS